MSLSPPPPPLCASPPPPSSASFFLTFATWLVLFDWMGSLSSVCSTSYFGARPHDNISFFDWFNLADLTSATCPTLDLINNHSVTDATIYLFVHWLMNELIDSLFFLPFFLLFITIFVWFGYFVLFCSLEWWPLPPFRRWRVHRFCWHKETSRNISSGYEVEKQLLRQRSFLCCCHRLCIDWDQMSHWHGRESWQSRFQRIVAEMVARPGPPNAGNGTHWIPLHEFSFI